MTSEASPLRPCHIPSLPSDWNDCRYEVYYSVVRAGDIECYLAGPMRGYENYNFPVFDWAAQKLRDAGWIVNNPAENDRVWGEQWQVDAAIDELRSNHKEANPLKLFMRKDLHDVLRSHCVLVLPGWQESQGARLEVHVAHETGTPVFDFVTMERIYNGADEVSVAEGWQKSPEVLPVDSQARKNIPLVTGVLDYFPAALAAVAAVSKAGNDKHNPGEPLHWARGKSTDQADAVGRHLLERGGIDPDTGMRYSAQLAWRALALLQIELEEAGEAPIAKGARA